MSFQITSRVSANHQRHISLSTIYTVFRPHSDDPITSPQDRKGEKEKTTEDTESTEVLRGKKGMPLAKIAKDAKVSGFAGTGFNGEGVFQPPIFKVMGDPPPGVAGRNVPPSFPNPVHPVNPCLFLILCILCFLWLVSHPFLNPKTPTPDDLDLPSFISTRIIGSASQVLVADAGTGQVQGSVGAAIGLGSPAK